MENYQNNQKNRQNNQQNCQKPQKNRGNNGRFSSKTPEIDYIVNGNLDTEALLMEVKLSQNREASLRNQLMSVGKKMERETEYQNNLLREIYSRLYQDNQRLEAQKIVIQNTGGNVYISDKVA